MCVGNGMGKMVNRMVDRRGVVQYVRPHDHANGRVAIFNKLLRPVDLPSGTALPSAGWQRLRCVGLREASGCGAPPRSLGVERIGKTDIVDD